MANYFCQSFGGQFPVPKNEDEVLLITSLLQKSNKCSNAYIGAKKSEDGILDLSGNNVTYFKWDNNQPNGKKIQKCIEIKQNSFYNDQNCERKNCFGCQIPTRNMYTLRGKIQFSDIDRYFFVDMSNDNIEIRGFEKTVCTYNDSWKFGSNSLTNESNALLPPVGLKVWKNSNNISLIWKFTQCKSDEFTCHAFGNCISITKRCDGHPDCPFDNTDEKGCQLMSFKEGYNRKYPPDRKSTTVYIMLAIQNVYAIHELESDYTVRVQVSLLWFDSRITFKNLKPGITENLLDKHDIEKIWLPEVVFANSNDKQRVKAGHGNDWTMAIGRTGTSKTNSLNDIDEDYLYSGAENKILLLTSTQVKLHCKFNLGMYPFDTQRCQIEIEVPYEYFEQFKLKLYEDPTVINLDVAQYEFIGIEYNKTKAETNKVTITVKLRRIPTYHLTNTYIPTFCLIIITELTLFIDVSHFEATIMVALTAMLVMYTLYQSLSDSLPQTAYLKMIDIWLFSGLILPFIIICILIVLDSLVLDEKKQGSSLRNNSKRWSSKAIKKAMQICIPTLTIILCLLYLIVAFYNYCNQI